MAARVDGAIAGYALWRTSRSEVVLTHVCVATNFRRQGIARRMVKEVSSQYPARHGLRAKCRDDYEIHAFWRSMGFDYLGRTHGRGGDRAPMTVWWRDHGIPNLFSPTVDETSTVLRVAVDTNILMDLHTRPASPQAKRSQVLLGPDLADRLELVVPWGLEKDLEDQKLDHRARLISVAESYTRPNADPVRAASLFDTLRAAVESAIPGFPAKHNDLGDLWQIAYAAAADVNVLATWDEKLIRDVGPLAAGIDRPEFTGFRVIDPDHLIIHIDQLAHAAAYHPQALSGSEFSVERARADSEPALLEAFLDKSTTETKASLKGLLRQIARANTPTDLIRDADKTIVAAHAVERGDKVLRVPFLRVCDHAYTETMARRLLWLLRERAREHGAHVVAIEDVHLSPSLRRAARHEAYELVNGCLYAWVIDHCGTGLEVSAAVTEARASVGLSPASLLKPGIGAEIAGLYESSWWPAKITDSQLPHYAVPIQPRWSTTLFGYPEPLLERSAELALGREQVYYRSGRNSPLTTPSRIVWFMSQDKDQRPKRAGEPPASSFIGTSLLDAIETDTPENLHSTLRHYGVFTLDQVRGRKNAAGLAQALRVSDTELYPSPVSWKRYTELLKTLDGPKRIQSPATMGSAMFAAIYELGQTRSTTHHNHGEAHRDHG
jgi:hypothetical protein